MGLWAPSDEAIAALTSLTDSGVYDYKWLCSPVDSRGLRTVPGDVADAFIVPVRFRVPKVSANLVPYAAISAPFGRLLAPISLAFNHWLSPRIRKAISNILVRTAQGCDIPGAVLSYVSPWPLPLKQPRAGLPDEIIERLETAANRQSAKIGPALRQTLAVALLDGTPLPQLMRTGKLPVDTSLLLHTAYFDDTDVLRLIVLHITRKKTMEGADERLNDGGELGRWLDETSSSITSRLMQFCQETTIGYWEDLFLREMTDSDVNLI